MSQYFPSSYKVIKIKLNLFNYATNCGVKKTTGVDENEICKKMA